VISIHPVLLSAALWPLVLALIAGFGGGFRSAPVGDGALDRRVRGALAGGWRMLWTGLVLSFGGLLVMAVVMALALVLTIQLEGNLLNPFILGKAVQIHPLGILMGVTAGTILGGIFGAFIAVPLVAVLNNVVNDIHDRGAQDPDPQT